MLVTHAHPHLRFEKVDDATTTSESFGGAEEVCRTVSSERSVGLADLLATRGRF